MGGPLVGLSFPWRKVLASKKLRCVWGCVCERETGERGERERRGIERRRGRRDEGEQKGEREG